MFSFPYRSLKLRIQDLRQDFGCEIKCLLSCAHLEHSILMMGAQHSIASSETEVQPSNQAMELIENISLVSGIILREHEYLALLLNKVEESLASLLTYAAEIWKLIKWVKTKTF